MKAEIQDVETVLSHLGSKQYKIPSYQRPYIWDKDMAEQLLLDIHDSCKEGQGKYFIGGLICIRNSDFFEVVDGQQRLITLTLILRELVRIVEDDQQLTAQLKTMYLYEDAISEDRSKRPVIEIREKERKFYNDHVLSGMIKQPPEKDSDTEKVFRNNSDAIREFLNEKCSLSFDELIRYLLRQVYAVFVEVDDRESSFRIFHVLNHRGQSLNDADLIKNSLLESVSSNKMKYEEVEENWKTIENNIGIENIDTFLRLNADSEKKDRNRVKSKLYPYYTNQLKQNKSNSDNVDHLSFSLAQSAELYSDIFSSDAICPRTLALLDKIGQKDEWIPAFMAFRKKFPDIHSEQFGVFSDLFQRAYIQTWLRDEHKSQREAVRYYAVEAINKEGASFESVINCIRDLSSESNRERPFDQVLDKPNFYDSSRPRIINLVKSILLRIDETYEDDDIDRTYKGQITIEHILPQKMESDYWTSRFDEEQHRRFCNILGNLTLLSRRKNSIAYNSSFDKKKEAYEYSNRKSSFNMTKELCDLSEWNLERLKERHEKLKSKAIHLWGIEY